MSPWEDRHVGELVDELDRRNKVPQEVADEARAAIGDGRYREALDIVIDGE